MGDPFFSSQNRSDRNGCEKRNGCVSQQHGADWRILPHVIDALISGRLQADPVKRVARNGKPYATVPMLCAQQDGAWQRINVTAFDVEAMAALLHELEGRRGGGKSSLGTTAGNRLDFHAQIFSHYSNSNQQMARLVWAFLRPVQR